MLQQKQKEVPYIGIFKLGSGEEFVCKVLQETANAFIVSKPLTLGQTQKGVQFVPILMLADPDKSITIPKPVIEGEPSPELISQYESITTGIALPQKSAIQVAR
jgi:hypothetical protein